MTDDPRISDDALYREVKQTFGRPDDGLRDKMLDEQRLDWLMQRIVSAGSTRAETKGRVTPHVAPRGTTWAPRRIAIGVACLLIASALAAGLATLGTSDLALAADFPIFSQAPAHPSRADVEALREAQVQLERVRAIYTPRGTGYVTSSKNGRRLCVAVPEGIAQLAAANGDAPNGRVSFVGGCASRQSAERKGLLLTAHPSSSSLEVFVVLPDDASTPVLRGRLHSAELADRHGVAIGTAHEPATLEYQVNGQRVSTRVAPGAVGRLRPER